MHVTNEKILPHAKSHTSIYELFGSTLVNNTLYKNAKRGNVSIFQTTCDNTSTKYTSERSEMLNQTSYTTCEKYHVLNKDSSHKSIIHSTSTLFYNLDDITKRHSFHYISEFSSSNANVRKVMNISLNPNGFKGKANAIVQECGTQLQPNIIHKDSIEINSKKIKKYFPNDADISSEIFLRDDYADTNKNSHYNNKELSDRQQKFWSYAKYRTEYTNPLSEKKKHKKKDRGKRTEDPCPCQLFSYACPCSDKKSLTELAQNSESFMVAHQSTSTSKIISENLKNIKATNVNNNKNESIKENKPTSAREFKNFDIATTSNPVVKDSDQNDSLKLMNNMQNIEGGSIISKSNKRRKKIVCPNCREKVEIMSTTEEEDSLKCNNLSSYKIRNILSKSYAYRSSPIRNRPVNDDGTCEHEPRCELIPICQILPTDNIYVNPNIKKMSPKSTPRIIRITKACRHHPPCTVAPSCQRANILKNNCEFIPPCLHQPRCVNLPLCVPICKNLFYDETTRKVDNIENNDCPHIPRCKYIPECQRDINSVRNMDNSINMVSQVQNACEFLNGFQSPPYSTHTKSPCLANSFSPCQIPSLTRCNCYKSNKSCQYHCLDCKCNITNLPKEHESSEAVIFIRDVGCQFRNKNYSHTNSVLQSTHSSTSFDLANVRKGDYYTNVHTLIYEDKFTNPISCNKGSESTLSISNLGIDSQCPTSKAIVARNSRDRNGFNPKPTTSPYIAAFTTYTGMFPSEISVHNNKAVDKSVHPKCQFNNNIFTVKSHRSFFRGKYKKMLTVKRRRKSRVSSHYFTGLSRKCLHY
ncbi:uncharacterized protein LOC131848021 [Achroia grisella]|uniref:uncharacterized protein LOC131848021 n=1 Tax=Achroia grisella TaxID=688607 RepID=UPI0027D33EC5|nr:uncharacterized protein LOC131848021 [Achroia grisella]